MEQSEGGERGEDSDGEKGKGMVGDHRGPGRQLQGLGFCLSNTGSIASDK